MQPSCGFGLQHGWEGMIQSSTGSLTWLQADVGLGLECPSWFCSPACCLGRDSGKAGLSWGMGVTGLLALCPCSLRASSPCGLSIREARPPDVVVQGFQASTSRSFWASELAQAFFCLILSVKAIPSPAQMHHRWAWMPAHLWRLRPRTPSEKPKLSLSSSNSPAGA